MLARGFIKVFFDQGHDVEKIFGVGEVYIYSHVINTTWIYQ